MTKETTLTRKEKTWLDDAPTNVANRCSMQLAGAF